MKKFLLASLLISASALSLAKLPAPSDEAKAKAAEAAAKTAWAGKVDGFALCKAQDKAAAKTAKSGKAGKSTATPPCADPGPFVYTPAVAGAPVAAAPAAAPAVAGAPAAKAPAAAPAKKS
jgi:Tfp pilus assembly protein PilV